MRGLLHNRLRFLNLEKRNVAFAFSFGLLVSGCSVIQQDLGGNLSVDMHTLSTAPDYHHILKLMGPPHKVSYTDHGMVFMYEKIRLIERQAGISLETNEVVLFKAVVARENVDRQQLIVLFDKNGNVHSYSFDEWRGVAAEGGALQLVFSLAGVADEGALSDPPAIHDWGFGLLQSDILRQLNRQNSMDTGRSGLEQKGTPTAVGQSALEFR